MRIFLTTWCTESSNSADVKLGCYAYLSLHGALFFPSIKYPSHGSIAFIQKTNDDGSHLTFPVVFLDYRLVLVYDHGNVFEQSREGCDVEKG